MPNPFAIEGEWLKGNAHAHTTNSDGGFSPQQVVDIYAEREYRFLAITDHNKVTPIQDLDSRGMALITGIEVTAGKTPLLADFHIVGLGLKGQFARPDSDEPATLAAALAEQAEVCILGHPFWTMLSYADIAPLTDYIVGLEVFNTICHLVGRGTSEYMWNLLLAHGHRVWGLAADDLHHELLQCGTGWIMAKAADDRPQTIRQALRQGLFYASSGPEIYNVEQDGEYVAVDCSPCQEVLALGMGGGPGRTSHYMTMPRPFEHVRINLRDPNKLYRIVCIDQTGRRAWTNPFLM